MPFHPPVHPTGLLPYERSLVCGWEKTGKSSIWISIARMMAATGSTNTVHVMDTDNAAAWMLGAQDRNVRVYPGYDYPELVSAASQIRASVVPGDVLAVDLLSRVWPDKMSNYYIEKVHGADPVEFFVKAETKASKEGLSVWQYMMKNELIDWNLIKRWYLAWFEPLAFRLPCHSFFLCEVDEINSKFDKGEVLTEWQRIGFKPEGFKKTGYYSHSTVILQRPAPGVHLVTIKERDFGGRKRPEVTAMPYKDFAMDVMINKWGWSIG